MTSSFPFSCATHSTNANAPGSKTHVSDVTFLLHLASAPCTRYGLTRVKKTENLSVRWSRRARPAPKSGLACE
jgi:hypothetical protein